MHDVKKLWIIFLGLVLSCVLMTACDPSNDYYCYDEGIMTYDEYCTYVCKGGNWEASCENKELEHCLNLIVNDFGDCYWRYLGEE